MQYKLIAADMDGTLLDSEGKITPKTEEYIRKAAEKGIYFTPSTGRPMSGVEKFRSQLPMNAPVITYNGAMIVAGNGKDVLFSQTVDGDDAAKVFELGKKFGTTICVWSQNQLYANEINERVLDYRKLSGIYPIKYDDPADLIAQGITKILWTDEIPRINQFLSEIPPELIPGTTFCTSKPIFLEFFSKKVSKAVALQKVCELVGIDISETIAVGDGQNDLPMLRAAGLGVAMGNAKQEIKDQCGYVTSSNDDDGIADMIEKLLL